MCLPRVHEAVALTHVQRIVQTQGFAVRPSQRYPLIGDDILFLAFW